MNKLFSKIVSAVTAATVSLFATSRSIQTLVNEINSNAVEENVILGDVNGDQRVDVFDLCLIKKVAINHESTSINMQAADVNADGVVDIKDATEVQDFILGRTTFFSAHRKEAINSIKKEVNELDYTIITTDADIETSLTSEIASAIDKLGDPVKVYEYLYNAINTEFYFGSRKGAIGTYEQHGGNDIDQASLLIASLRYLGYNADYISAFVELTPQQAMDITGTSNVDIAYNVLGIQVTPEIKTLKATYDDSNTISSITIEHTWVTAELPSKFINGDDSEELVKVQLDTSFKPLYRSNISNALSNTLGEENADKLSEYIVSGNSACIDTIIDDLDQKYDGKEFNEIFHMKELLEFSVIPVSKNKIVSTNTVEGSEYLDGRRDQILFNIGGKNAAVLSSADAYGKEIVVEYDFDSNYDLFEEILDDVPETIFDITPFHTKCGLGVQAYIKLDGKVIGEGESVPIGTEQEMTISVYTDGKINQLKTTNMLAGSMYAVTLDTQNIANDDINKSIQAMSEEISDKTFQETYNAEYLGSYLSAIGKLYMSEADTMKTMYADEYNIHTERFLSVCVTAFNLDIIPNIIGQLEVQNSGTIGLDVKSNSISAVSLKGIQDDVDKFYLNAGIQGSYLEGEVLESVTGIESVSTMKLFDVAKEKNIEIISISKKDADCFSKIDMLKSNGISSFVIAEITEYIEAGYEVVVPVQNIRLNSWSGIGYIVVSDNGYSFMLSNGTNGGETTNTVTNLRNLVENIVFWAFAAALLFSIISFCSAGWVFVPILSGEKALTAGVVISAVWSACAVSSAAEGLGDVIEGTVTNRTKARVTVTTLGKTIWKLIWKVVNG